METNQIKCSGCKQLVTCTDIQGFKTCKRCRDRQKFLRTLPEQQEYKKSYYQSNKEKASLYGMEYRRSLNGRFKKAKKAAPKRGINFDLTFEQFVEIVSKPCYYCNGFFPYVEAGSGVDRLDNLQGYVIGNSVSCCDTCNTLKNSIFSPEETKAAIEAIIKVRKHNV